MKPKEDIHRRSCEFFEKLWAGGDYWQLETSPYEQARFVALEGLIADRRYGRILEIGCGAGAFTRRLAAHGDYVLGLDISPAAIERGRNALADLTHVDLAVANIMEHDWEQDQPWDLIVLTETVYYLGWLYPFFDVGWMSSQAFETTRPGGRLLLANLEGGCRDYLLLPWLIRTYHDLYANVGYQVERDEIFRGERNGMELSSRMTLFCRPK